MGRKKREKERRRKGNWSKREVIYPYFTFLFNLGPLDQTDNGQGSKKVRKKKGTYNICPCSPERKKYNFLFFFFLLIEAWRMYH